MRHAVSPTQLRSALLSLPVFSSAADSEGKSSRLVCVAICQGWNPPSIRTAKEVERLRATAAVKTPLFLIDHDDDKNKTSQLKYD